MFIAVDIGLLHSKHIFYSIQLYSVYIFPTLLFLVQLELPPPNFRQVESKVLAALTRGSAKWILPEDLKIFLKSSSFSY